MARAPRCVPLAQWPAIDRTRWEIAHRRGSLLDDPGPAADWRPATSAKIQNGYGRWLAFLEDDGRLDPEAEPQARVTREVVCAYVEALRCRNASGTVFGRVQELSVALRVLAPGAQPRWLRQLVN